MAAFVPGLVRFVQARFRALADPARAGPMAAYMKTAMPFYGVPKPQRTAVCRAFRTRFVPASQRAYEAATLALWNLPHREEKYAALAFALQHPGFITCRSLKLYERLVREGAWWDLVDDIAIRLIGRVRLDDRPALRARVKRWIDDDDLWIRRTAIISQIGHKQQTDEAELFDHCLRRAAEREFFIRKAIGWALREYSHAAPQAVKRFLLTHRDRLSPLSFREAAKQLVRSGAMPASR